MRPFYFKGNELTTITDKNGDPWFVAKEVCGVLGITDHIQATRYLDEDEKGLFTKQTLGGSQKVTIINESGLYSLVLRSRKPEAKEFRKWITSEVLPAIRKTGGYIHGRKITSLRIYFNKKPIIKTFDYNSSRGIFYF